MLNGSYQLLWLLVPFLLFGLFVGSLWFSNKIPNRQNQRLAQLIANDDFRGYWEWTIGRVIRANIISSCLIIPLILMLLANSSLDFNNPKLFLEQPLLVLNAIIIPILFLSGLLSVFLKAKELSKGWEHFKRTRKFADLNQDFEVEKASAQTFPISHSQSGSKS